MVHAVTAQITNIVSAVRDLASRGVTGAPLIDGTVMAVQALGLLPVTVGVAGVNGLADTLTEAGATAWTRITNGAAAAVTTWLGNGTDLGAVQAAITRIGNDPLSAAAYTDAASMLVGAAVNTARIAIGTAQSMTSAPFRVGADLTNTGADVIKTFNRDVATAAAGMLHAAGLPSFVSNLPHVMASAVNASITIAAFAASTTLDGIASAIDIGNTLTGALPAQQALTLSTASSDAPELTAASARASAQAGVDAEPSEKQSETDKREATETGSATTESTTTATSATDPTVDTAAESTEATTEAPTVSEPDDVAAEETTEATEAADTTGAGEPDEPATGTTDTTTAGDRTSTTKHTTADEPKKADEPTAAAPVKRTENNSESITHDKEDAAAKPGEDNGSTRATPGRHAQGTLKNGTTVNEIKTRLDKETPSSSASTNDSTESAAAA